MKITPKQQMKIGRKVREMTIKGYSKEEIVKCIQKMSATEFINMEVSKKES